MTITKTLHELDDEIELRRRQINVLRVEIAQIEEARRTQLWLVEDRQRRHEIEIHLGKQPEPLQVVVRNRQAAIANGHAQETVSEKHRDYAAEHVARKKRKDAGTKKPSAAETVSKASVFRAKILHILDGDREGMSRVEMGDHLGLPRGDKVRKHYSNALYSLLHKRQLRQDAQGRYHRA